MQVSIAGSLPNKNTTLIQTCFNALNITDVVYHYATVAISLVSPYKELFFIVKSTLDNATHNAVLNLYVLDNGNIVTPVQTKALPDYTGVTQIVQKSDMLYLGFPGCFTLDIRVACAVAPTIGTVTIQLFGIPN